jgi:hypothetical protein
VGDQEMNFKFNKQIIFTLFFYVGNFLHAQSKSDISAEEFLKELKAELNQPNKVSKVKYEDVILKYFQDNLKFIS